MAGFNLNNAKAPASKYNRDKLSPGEHLVRVRDVREHKGFKGLGFFLDFEVVEGPSGVGFQSSYMVYPDNAIGGGKMTREMAYQLELGKIQQAVAAVVGLTKDQAGEVTDERYQAAIARPVSPLRGRLVVINAVPHTNKAGNPTVYYTIAPYFGEQDVDTSKAVTKAAPKAPGIPKAPSAPKAELSVEEILAKGGFTIHPEDSTYAFSGDVVELVTDVLARLKSEF